MKVVIDIEANGLKPTKIWVIVAKDLVTGSLHVFRRPSDDDVEKARFLDFFKLVGTFIGHNWLGYDWPALRDCLGVEHPDIVRASIDTYIASKVIDFPRDKHGVADYGIEFGLEKIEFNDWSGYSKEMEDYCIRDVLITEKIYSKYKKYLDNPLHTDSILLEQYFQLIVNKLQYNGFAIDVHKVLKLLDKVTTEIQGLDSTIKEVFVDKLQPIRTIEPKATKYGTISLSTIPKELRKDIHEYSVDAPFTYCKWVSFNPDSPKQRIEVLNKSGWRPEEKTKAHIEVEREVKRLERQRRRSSEFDLTLQELYTRLKKLKEYGWKVNEANLSTLPPNAPAPARLLSKRIITESRRKTLQEWIDLEKDGRIHGQFQGIGAWTHRMSHQKPNMANITNEFDNNGKIKYLGKELRQCWVAPRNRLLVGVDAEGIQLRIFAHLINDPELIKSLVEGKKSDKTDPHSLNKSVLGDVCKTRAAAKRFIYALFLGAGLGKLQQILECDEIAARDANERFLGRYPGLVRLRNEVIPADAKRGWFVGLDGRRVRIPGDTESERRHLAMSGYLQNGEAIVIKRAAVLADPELDPLDSFLVDIVHDEFQAETPNDLSIAMRVAEILDNAIRSAGDYYKLNCPMAGSYWNDDHNEYTIGRNWYRTH